MEPTLLVGTVFSPADLAAAPISSALTWVKSSSISTPWSSRKRSTATDEVRPKRSSTAALRLMWPESCCDFRGLGVKPRRLLLRLTLF